MKPGEFDDVAIAGLDGSSIMEEEDPAVRELLAAQLKPVKDPDEIPAAGAALRCEAKTVAACQEADRSGLSGKDDAVGGGGIRRERN